MTFVEVLFALVLGHYLCDFPLQGDATAKGKNPWNCVDPARVPPGQKIDKTVWAHYLTSHAAVHAIPVWLITGQPSLAAAEFACHWAIDLCKCANLFGIKTDQAMHLLCKVVWALIATGVLLNG